MEDYHDFKDLLNVFKMQKQTVMRSYCSYFYSYYKNYFDNPKKIIIKINEMKILISRFNIKDNLVLIDLGCGFGLDSIILSLLLKNINVVGIDSSEEKIRIAKNLSEKIGAKSINFIISKGENLPKELKADIILCKSVVSHVNNINIFLDSILKHLRLNGLLYIIDDRNALNPRIVCRTKLIQKRVENGFIDNDMSFLSKRKEIIQNNFEKLDEKKVIKYARKTAGLYGDQIIAHVQSLEEDKKVRNPKFKYIDPITGVACERLYNPYFIKKLLVEKGTHPVIDKPIFDLSMENNVFKKIMMVIVIKFHPLSLLLQPFYNIKAIKI